jgi:aspartate aminotransferase
MKKIIADRSRRIDASGIRKVFALASSLKDPVNFSIGQPDFDVPEKLKDEAINAIRHGINKYSQTAGNDVLLKKISNYVQNETGWKNPSVLVSSGVSGGLLLAFLALVNPGDEVIIPDPYFVIYKHIVNMVGGKCVFVDCYPNFRLPVEKRDSDLVTRVSNLRATIHGSIAEAITEKTKIIILNSPCNPTGIVYTQNEIEALAKVAREKDIIVLSDEIYESFSYDSPCPSIAKCYEKTLLMRGFSKAYAMTGWRLGYVAANEILREVIEQMIKIQQYTFVCAPAPFQVAAAAAMDYDVSEFVEQYRKKRDLLYNGLKEKFELVKPEGAFYAFVKAPDSISASEFVSKAIANNVLIIPGNVFSEKDTHFRISYATSDEKIRRGMEILLGLV